MIINHTISRVIYVDEPSVTWYFSVAYLYLSKTAVPLFIMIAGANLLGRDEGYRTTARRIRRILEVLVGCAVIYHIAFYGFHGMEDIKSIILSILQNGASGEFWYLYLYIGILLSLPFLQKMCSRMEEKDFKVFFLISTISCGMIPIAAHWIPQIQTFYTLYLDMFSSYLMYLLAGHYICKKKTTSKGAVFAAGVIAVGVFVSTILTYIEYTRDITGENFLYLTNISYINVVFPSMALFYLIKHLTARIAWKEHSKNVVKWIGGMTFGVYLLGDLIIRKTDVVWELWVPYMGMLPSMVLYQLGVFFVGFIVTVVLKHIPVVRNRL